MKQTMKPNLSRDDSEDDDLCRSVQFRGRPFVTKEECHLPNLLPSSVNGDIQRFLDSSYSKQDKCCSTLRPESGGHIHLPWGRLVTDRNSVPDLMSEEVDEEIEQFMALPLKETNESLPSRHKRRHSNDQHLSNVDGGSPTSKQRLHTGGCYPSCDLQEEVARWFQETFGCGKTDVDSSCFDEKQQEQWIDNWKCLDDGMPEPKALRRQSPFARENVHPKMLEREALLPPSTPIQECNEKQQALSLQEDSDHAMSLPFINRFDTRHDGGGHGEVYPEEQVKIDGNDSSHDSLRNVHAAVYPCVGCGQCLVANKGTKLLYCQQCGTLAPIDVLEEARED